MELEAGAAPEDYRRLVDAALAAGLRAVDVTRLPHYAPGHTAKGRLWFVTVAALNVGGPFDVIAVAPDLVARVAVVLANADGDVVLERLLAWIRKGVADA